MSALLNVFFGWPIVKRIRSNNNDDQHVDRLNHRYTVGWILVGVFLSSTTTFVFNRISCWLPTELRHSSYWKYIETYCYVSNTYFIPTNITPPHTNEERRDLQIGKHADVLARMNMFGNGFCMGRILSMGPIHSVAHGVVLLHSSTLLAIIQQSFRHRYSNVD